MAGQGRRAQALERTTDVRHNVRSDGKVGGFELPEGYLPDGEEWHPATVQWWEAMRRSPQATIAVTDPDWMFLLDTALIHHTMWKNKRWEYAAEIRMRVAKFGVTPEDRRALKMGVDAPDEFSVGGKRGHVSVMDDEGRRRLINQ